MAVSEILTPVEEQMLALSQSCQENNLALILAVLPNDNALEGVRAIIIDGDDAAIQMGLQRMNELCTK